MTDAEVDALRAELSLLQTEYDRWVTVALERRTELANLDATVTAAMFALSDTGGADGWCPPRGVSPLIDRALDVREARDAQRKRADSLALAYREQQGENDAIKIEAERHRRIADEAIDRQDVQLHAERAAVVAWLHEKAQAWSEDILDTVATDIDCGEHRREGED